MPYRFTDTDKWGDGWFVDLKPTEKLLFMYLCDNCDIAGFIEINTKKWATDTGYTIPQIKGALKGLRRGLIYSDTNDCVYIRNFLKHQKNLPINERNQAHKGIIKRFNKYKYKFDIEDYVGFIEGAQKGLERGYGIGKGNGIDSNVEEHSIVDSSTKLGEAIKFYQKEVEEYDNEKYKILVDFLLGNNDIGEPLEKCLAMNNPINRNNFEKLLHKAHEANRKLTQVILALENDQRQLKPKKKYNSFSMTVSTWLNNSKK